MPTAESARNGAAVTRGTAREILARCCDRDLLDRLQAMCVERIDVAGDMLTEVRRAADRVDAQLIAVPNQGPPGAVRIFLPNLAEPLLLSARCSVLVAPDETSAGH
jgi:nucleotide-binding universal stress UspA family protein